MATQLLCVPGKSDRLRLGCFSCFLLVFVRPLCIEMGPENANIDIHATEQQHSKQMMATITQ
eukprot:scaffold2767_cov177-Amphora_coffeaeformis.AAC.20